MLWSLRSPRLRALVLGTLALGVSAVAVPPAHALLTSGPDIIPAPASVANTGGATNTHQQAFNEQQGVVLATMLTVDSGSIAAGTPVDSHMIFLNQPDNATGLVSDSGVVWTFDGPILGVISDQAGVLLAASDFLGATGTSYPGAFPSRGLEGNTGTGPNDGYAVSGNSITVSMNVSQPGDWIRVITAARPHSTDACKQGSWQSYLTASGQPLFRNQGDCVSFVATGGRNQPAGR